MRMSSGQARSMKSGRRRGATAMIRRVRRKTWKRYRSLDTGNRCRRGSGDFGFGQLEPLHFLREIFDDELRLLLVASARGDEDEPFVGRIMQAAAEGEFLLDEAGVIVMPRELDGRVKWHARLDEDFAAHLAAPAAPRDLHEQLEDPFAGAEVGDLQREIRR